MDDQLVRECINLMQEEPVPNSVSGNSNFVITEFLRTILTQHNNDTNDTNNPNENNTTNINIENIINKNDRKINYEFEINEKYISLSDRLESYKYWPKYFHISAIDMAKAGFYYLGVGDYVKCVCCGIVLNDWMENDSPENEHIINSDSCSYVKLFLEDIKEELLSDCSLRDENEGLFTSKKDKKKKKRHF